MLDSSGKRVDSIGKTHSFDFPEIENKAFVEIKDGKIFVCYKFNPLLEIYDLKSKTLLHSFNFSSSIFPDLIELKRDKKFINPEPGRYLMPKFVAGVSVVGSSVFVLLHTPNPQIIEFTEAGKEIGRYIASETEALDYFGFSVRLTKDTKQFFVGAIDYSNKPSLVVYEQEP